MSRKSNLVSVGVNFSGVSGPEINRTPQYMHVVPFYTWHEYLGSATLKQKNEFLG